MRALAPALLGLLGLAAAACSPPPSPPPSILVVVLDTVRADRTSTYGYGRPTTPQLDAIAAAGTVFEDTTAPASWTWPSHASLFTGEPPWVHGARVAQVEKEAMGEIMVTPMRRDLPTLAQRLGEAGYRTVALASNTWLSDDLGLTRGFDHVELQPNDDSVVRAALEEIDRSRDRPLFLFVNLLSAHAPYREGPGPWNAGPWSPLGPETVPEWARPYLIDSSPNGLHFDRVVEGDDASGVLKFLRGELPVTERDLELLGRLYDAGVRAADFALGRILGRWVTVHPDGALAVTSDHGEALGEHGRIDHRCSVYSEVLSVPLVLAGPGVEPGARIRTPVGMTALHPTVLAWAGLDAGRPTLLDVATGTDPGPVEAAAWPGGLWALRVGGPFRHLWHHYREGDHALLVSTGGDTELYDMRDDPAMDHDLSERQPELHRRMLDSALQRIAQAEAAPEPEPVEISPETREALRRLGYVE